VLLASSGIIHVPGVFNYYRRSITEATLSSSTQRKYLHNTLLTIGIKGYYLQQAGGHPLLNRALALQYLRFAVYQYPVQKQLSTLAWRKYRQLGVKVKTPKIGGAIFEALSRMLGWKPARWLRYQLKEGR
jgi:hypothetical protein